MPEITETTEKTRQMSFAVLDDGTIRADFGPGLDPLTLDPQALPENLMVLAISEGIISRLRSYGSKLTGEARTASALRDVMAGGIANLLAGQWKVERAPGEGGEISQEAEAAYLFRVKRAEAKGETYSGTMAEAAEAFAALDDAKKKQLKAVPLYQIALLEVKAKRNAAKSAKLAKKAEEDTEALF